eukprot:scaffold213_cov245-Pinguiococcus_pyrenoidosus.AAC.20
MLNRMLPQRLHMRKQNVVLVPELRRLIRSVTAHEAERRDALLQLIGVHHCEVHGAKVLRNHLADVMDIGELVVDLYLGQDLPDREELLIPAQG